ncbi:MAG TPA: hypothetical protein VGN01_07265 [Acidobacteriaceae bacterium]|jgi:hypothetical protein
MFSKDVLFELLLTGFFALACLRAQVAHESGRPVRLNEIFRFRGRIERLRRSRVQWISILVLLTLARIQWSLSLFVEFLAAVMFLGFLALPSAKSAVGTQVRR